MRLVSLLVMTAFSLIAVGILGVMLATSKVAAAPTLINSQPLPCGGALNYFDTDGDPSNGAEQLTVTVPDENAPRAIILFGDGAEGKFKSAKVAIPGRPAENFTDFEKFQAAYPHPCVIVEAQVARR